MSFARTRCRSDYLVVKYRQGSNVALSFADQLPQATISCKAPSGERCRRIFYGSVTVGNYFCTKHRRGVVTLSFTNQLPQATILRKVPSGGVIALSFTSQLPTGTPSGEHCHLVFYESVAAGNYLAVKHRQGSVSPCLLRISCRRQLFVKDSFCEKMCRFLLPGGLATANCLFSLIRSPHAERTDLFPATRP